MNVVSVFQPLTVLHSCSSGTVWDGTVPPAEGRERRPQSQGVQGWMRDEARQLPGRMQQGGAGTRGVELRDRVLLKLSVSCSQITADLTVKRGVQRDCACPHI